MKRREFLKAGMVATGGALVAERLVAQGAARQAARRFRLDYAPHFGMFKHLAGDNLTDQLTFAAEQGFTAWEDRAIARRPVDLQRRIARTMETLGMRLGVVAVIERFRDGSSLSNWHYRRWDVVQDVGQSIELAKRVNARWLTIDLGSYGTVLEWYHQKATCVEVLKRCAEVLQRHELVLVLEPSTWRNTRHGRPGDGLSLVQDICRMVDSSACKLLFDLYQQHCDGGDVLAQIDSSWPRIACFQCGDTRGRKEPGTGEIDYPRIFHHIASRGFTGVVGMEHGNSLPGRAGDQAVIDAYLRVDRC